MQTSVPLFERFPRTASLAHVPLVDRPTPVVEIGGALAEGCGGLWVKRDDVTSAAYGGNKVRKLEFTLARALAEGRRTVITFGALGSNHVLATAVHGGSLGMEVHAVLTPQVMTSYLGSNLTADLAVGAVLHPVLRAQDATRAAASLRAELGARDGVKAYVIPFGGTTPEAEAGFVNAALELCRQVEEGLLPEPDVVYVPLGSAGTATGLAIGFAAAAARTRVVGVRVVPDDVVPDVQISQGAEEAIAMLVDIDAGFPAPGAGKLPLEVREGHLGAGYAIPTALGQEALSLAAQAGIVLEGTYTAKALGALVQDARAGRLRGKTVLFWNTYNSCELPAGVARHSPVPDQFMPFVTQSDRAT